ncbi:MAG: hypothetical protein FJ291_14380 [Planctomycetes bacterium]|nr:hypothetical protein [Planctomycetota bacterium]
MSAAIKERPKAKRLDPTVGRGDPSKPMMTARDLLNSGLVGIWKDRTDIGDSLEFAAELRKRVQRRNRE